MKNVAGVFDNKLEAHQAISQLLADGFMQNAISLLMSERGRDNFLVDDETATNGLARGGAAGAAIGGGLGALFAGLTAVGGLAISGGSVLMAGPLVAMLSGAGAGGIVGGLSGALIGAGFAHDEASDYEMEIRAGKAVVVVQTMSDAEEAKARAAFRAVRMRNHAHAA